MPLQTTADAPNSAAPVSAATAAVTRLHSNSTPLKALVGGVLIGVVVGGFVSPMAGKISGQFSGSSEVAAPAVSVQATGSARSAIQDARVATGANTNSSAVPANAGEQQLILSTAGSEVDR